MKMFASSALPLLFVTGLHGLRLSSFAGNVSKLAEKDGEANDDGVNRDRARIVFVAGWEGTGHRFFDEVFRTVAAPTFQLGFNWNQFDMMGSDSSWLPVSHALNVALLRTMALAHPGEVLEIKAATSGSYPNGQGDHERRMHKRQPNIQLLVKAAQEADVDVKVLVLQRDAEETLVANCLHRTDLEACPAQSETLAANMEVLVKQLGALSPGAFTCVRYGDLEDLGRGLAFTLADSEKVELSDAAIRTVWSGEDHHDERANSEEIVGLAAKMRGPQQELDNLCSGSALASRETPSASLDEASAAGISVHAWQIVRSLLPPALLARADGRVAAAMAPAPAP